MSQNTVESLSWFQDNEWSYLEVSGADRVDFFNRLSTNRIPSVGAPLVHTFFLSVNAKVLAEFWVAAREERLMLCLPSEQLPGALENIERYHFGEKLDVVERAGQLFVLLGSAGAEHQALLDLGQELGVDPRYGDDARWIFCPAEQLEAFRRELANLGPSLSPEEAERRRVGSGRPRFGHDYTSDTLFLELAQQDDFSESKGCYPGQEIVARVLHRGRLNRHLRAFDSEQSIPVGWTYQQDGKEMARVTTSVAKTNGGSMGLLYVRREVGDEGAVLSSSGDPELSLTIKARAHEITTGDPE